MDDMHGIRGTDSPASLYLAWGAGVVILLELLPLWRVLALGMLAN